MQSYCFSLCRPEILSRTQTNLHGTFGPLLVERCEVIVMRSEELERLGDGCHRRGGGLDEVLNRIQGRAIQRRVRFL